MTGQEAREELSNHLFSLYDHGTSPNALREADSILDFLDARGYRKCPDPQVKSTSEAEFEAELEIGVGRAIHRTYDNEGDY